MNYLVSLADKYLYLFIYLIKRYLSEESFWNIFYNSLIVSPFEKLTGGSCWEPNKPCNNFIF
jgi:hypothetical protein